MSRISIILLILAGCGKSPASSPAATNPRDPNLSPAPADIEPIKNDYSIPRELGPSGSDGYPFTARIKFDRLKPGRIRKAPLTFVDVWNELARPARDEQDLLAKASFVRMTIPLQGVEASYPGGAEALLASIFHSHQHEVVRLAAMAALTGGCVRVTPDSSRRFAFRGSCFYQGDSLSPDACPLAVSSLDSPIYGKVMGDIAKTISSTRQQEDARVFLAYILQNGKGLPVGVESNYDVLATAILEDPHGFWMWPELIKKNEGARIMGLRVELLDARHHSRFQSLKWVLSQEWGDFKSPELKNALAKLKEDLNDKVGDPEYAEVFRRLVRNK